MNGSGNMKQNEIYEKVRDFKRRFPTTISWRIKSHSKVASKLINKDENILYAFAAQKSPTSFNMLSTFVFVLTDKRIVLAQKRMIYGYFYYSITPDMFNDLTLRMGLIWGKAIIDTVREQVYLSGLSRGITGAKAGVASANVREKGTASKIGAGVRGALAGTTTGLFAGAGAMINAKPGSNVAGTILGNTAKYNANKMALGEAGSTWLGRTKESMHRAFTGSSNFDKLKRQVKGEEDFVKMSKSFTSALKSEATKGKYGGVNLSGKNYAYENSISGTSKSLRAQAEIARSQGLADFYYHEIADDGSFLNTTKRISLDEVEVIASDLEKAEMQKGYAQLQAGTGQIVDGNPDLLASYQAVTAAAF